jgi:hypothetical protein
VSSVLKPGSHNVVVARGGNNSENGDTCPCSEAVARNSSRTDPKARHIMDYQQVSVTTETVASRTGPYRTAWRSG